MKSVIKIPAGYSLHDLKGIGGSVIRQYDLHGDTLQVWSTGTFNIKFIGSGEVVERVVYPSGDSVLVGCVLNTSIPYLVGVLP